MSKPFIKVFNYAINKQLNFAADPSAHLQLFLQNRGTFGPLRHGSNAKQFTFSSRAEHKNHPKLRAFSVPISCPVFVEPFEPSRDKKRATLPLAVRLLPLLLPLRYTVGRAQRSTLPLTKPKPRCIKRETPDRNFKLLQRNALNIRTHRTTNTEHKHSTSCIQMSLQAPPIPSPLRPANALV